MGVGSLRSDFAGRMVGVRARSLCVFVPLCETLFGMAAGMGCSHKATKATKIPGWDVLWVVSIPMFNKRIADLGAQE